MLKYLITKLPVIPLISKAGFILTPPYSPLSQMLGSYEIDAVNFLIKNLHKNAVFIDIGACVGYYSLIASKIVGEKGKIFSFEPDSRNYFLLKLNLLLNNAKNVIPFNIALSNFNGKINIELPPIFRSNLTSLQNKGKTKIIVRRLDNIFSKLKINKINGMKIDAEGEEFKIIEGCKDILNKINWLIIEISSENKNKVKKYLKEFKIYCKNKFIFAINKDD